MAFFAQNLGNENEETALTLSASLMTSLGFRSSYRLLRGAFFHGNKVQTVQFSPGGDRIATGCNDDLVRVWDIADEKKPLFEMNHEATVLCVSFHPTRPLLVSGGTKGVIRLWKMDAGQPESALSQIDLSSLTNYEESPEVRSAVFSNNGTRLVVTLGHEVAGAPDVALLRLSGDQLSLENWGALHDGQGFDAVFREGGESIMTCGWDLIETKAPFVNPKAIARLGLRIFNMDMVSGGSRVFLATADRNLVALDFADGGPEKVLFAESNRYKDQLRGLAVHPSGLVAVSGSDDGGVRFHDALTLEEVGSPLIHPGYVRSVDIDGEGNLVATACHDGFVRLWDMAAKGIIMHNDGSGDFCHAVDYSADGKHLAAGFRNGKVRVLDNTAVKKLVEITPQKNREGDELVPIRSLEYSLDGKWLAVGVGDTLELYDTADLNQPDSVGGLAVKRTMTAPGRIREICFGRGREIPGSLHRRNHKRRCGTDGSLGFDVVIN